MLRIMEWGKKSVNKQGQGIATDIGGVAADAFIHHGVPWLAKKTFEMGRYGASELMRNKKLQKKAMVSINLLLLLKILLVRL